MLVEQSKLPRLVDVLPNSFDSYIPICINSRHFSSPDIIPFSLLISVLERSGLACIGLACSGLIGFDAVGFGLV